MERRKEGKKGSTVWNLRFLLSIEKKEGRKEGRKQESKKVRKEGRKV